MEKLFFILALMFSACTHQSLHQHRSLAEVPESIATKTVLVTPELQHDLEQLESVFRPRIEVLDRDMVTFHYTDISNSNYVPLSLKDLQARMSNGYIENYFNPLKFDPTMNGAGLYVAVDPFSSQNRASRQPQLYVVTLSKGSIILNATAPYHGNEKATLQQVFDHLNCGRGGYRSYIGDPSRDGGLPMIIHAIRESSEEPCRRVLIRAVQDLGIQGFMDRYGYAANLSECRVDHSSREVLIVRSDAIRLETLNYYDNQSKIEGKPLSDDLVKLYAESGSNIVSSIPSSLRDASAAGSDYSEWKRNRIFGCGDKWNLEEP